MTDNRISDRGINALAAFISESRPDFESPGVVAALRAERDSDVWQLALRMIHRAAEPKNTSPRLQPFDSDGFVTCRQHPGASVRTNGDCGVCFAERYADDSGRIRDRGGVAPSPDVRAAMVAALSNGGNR